MGIPHRKGNEAACTQTEDSDELPISSSKKRRSFGEKIKDSSTHAKKIIASVFPSSTSRKSNSSNDCDGNGNSEMEYDYEMEEEFGKDLDLYELIQYRPWNPNERTKYDDDAVCWYANHHPRSFRVRYEFDKQGRGKTRYFPLQRIVSLGASLRTVEAVMKAYPPALLMRHHQNRGTALHSACAFPSPYQAGVIEFLVEHNPSSVMQTNCNAFLPIHNACSASLPSPIGLEAIQILVEAYPQSISKTNKLGETPVQAARRNQESLPDVLCYLDETLRYQQDEEQHNQAPHE